MRILIDGFSPHYGNKVKLVKTLMKRESPEEFPELLKFALQMLYFDGNGWVEDAGSTITLMKGSRGAISIIMTASKGPNWAMKKQKSP